MSGDASFDLAHRNVHVVFCNPAFDDAHIACQWKGCRSAPCSDLAPFLLVSRDGARR